MSDYSKMYVDSYNDLAGKTNNENLSKGYEDGLKSVLQLKLDEYGYELYGANENPSQKSWTNSPKVYAHMYIDDAALGCPLKMDLNLSDRPFVDWDGVSTLLKDHAIVY